MIPRISLRHLAGALATGALLAAIGAAGPAQAANGITPISPKSGATVPVGKSPTFKLRSSGSGHVWIHVCKSKKKNKDGVICFTAQIGEAKRGKGGVYSFKPKFFDFPAFWLNTPGTYYWQAHRIDCGTGNDCLQEGAITRFKVG
jgi:hypothetical protein